MKNAIAIFIALAILGMTSEVNARWRLFGRRSTVNVMANAGNKAHVQAWSTAIQADAQADCERKAQLMASRRVLSHGVMRIVTGCRFEGIGMGGPNCSTCTPGWRGAVLIGDASCRSSDGRVWRCRAWR